MGRQGKFGSDRFLRKLSCKVFEACPYALFVAEESTAFPKVTHPTYVGGLGFNYKWNMGWMNDVLSYMQSDTLWRSEKHNKLTFFRCVTHTAKIICFRFLTTKWYT